MGKSRQEAVTEALRQQRLLRERNKYLAAARAVATRQNELQLSVKEANRCEGAKEAAYLRYSVNDIRRQLFSGLEERRFKLKSMLQEEQKQAAAALQQLQHVASRKDHVVLQRAAALKNQKEKERNREDERLFSLRCRNNHEDLLAQEYKERLLEVQYAL